MSALRAIFRKARRPGSSVGEKVPPDVRAGVSEPARDRVDGQRSLGARAGALVDDGRFAEALALVAAPLAATPDDPELLFTKGRTLLAWGRAREALAVLVDAQARGLRTPDFHALLGWTLLGTGAPVAAERWMREAVAVDSDAWRAHAGLAKALQAQGRTAESIASFERALELRPDEIETIVDLGVCRMALHDAVAAEASFRSAIALDAGHANAWNNLGVALEHQRRHDEAREAYARAVRIEAGDAATGGSYVNLALSLQGAGRTTEALDVFERNLPLRAGADAHGNYAQALRTAGRLPEGWTHFEFRWLREPMLSSRPSLARPVWTGQDLRGKTILLRAEQGLGDTLQFIRYAPHVKALGATVLLSAQRALKEVLRGVAGVDRLLWPEDTLPPIDYYVHLLSLPGVFASGLDSIPGGVPYLQADAERSRHWSQRMQKSVLNVGVVWAGRLEHVRDRERSLSLRLLEPLGEVAGIRIHSLQKGPPAEEARSPPAGLELVDLAAELEDFADTAAVIDRLDLVISVDTSVAHLAGAMGKPVWLMLPRPAEWRWMEDRDDSPWYPTMRLFRQRERGDWADVVDRIKVALQARVREASANASKNEERDVPSGAARGAAPPIARLPRESPGHRPGLSAVAETRHGIVQYLPDEPIVGDAIGWYGEHLQAQLDLLCGLIPKGATVVEVCAGMGYHALPLSSAIGPEGHLVLVEPRVKLQQILRQNLTANRASNVTLMRGTLDGGASVRTETIDQWQMERLDWLKLNDGMSAATVIDGAAETLWRLRPRLFVGAPDAQALASLAGRLSEFGYRCWRMESSLFSSGNFNGRDRDIFVGGTALALVAIPEEVDFRAPLDGCVEIR